MHTEVAQFLRSCQMVRMLNQTVYEVGALDVNGRAADHMSGGWKSWLGFDLVAGAGVDVVGDAIVTLPEHPVCDVLVTTEVLEHAPEWDVLVGVMCDSIREGGWLVLTCAGPGRPPHAADGSCNGPHPGEWYRNVSLVEVAAVAAEHGVVQVYGEQVGGDTRFVGRKGQP